MKKYHCFFVIFFLSIHCHTLSAQNKAIDVQHYNFAISLNDTNNVIHGNAVIDFIVKQNADKVYFDLVSLDKATGVGMKVLHVEENKTELKFHQDKDHLNIYFNVPLKINQEKNISIASLLSNVSP